MIVARDQGLGIKNNITRYSHNGFRISINYVARPDHHRYYFTAARAVMALAAKNRSVPFAG